MGILVWEKNSLVFAGLTSSDGVGNKRKGERDKNVIDCEYEQGVGYFSFKAQRDTLSIGS